MSPSSAPLRLALAAMATRFELLLAADDADGARAAGEAALEEIEDAHRRLDLFAADSLVAQANREAFHRALPFDSEFLALIAACRRYAECSGGAFDPTVGPLLHLWGFRGSTAPPDATEQAARLIERLGTDRLQIDFEAATLRFETPELALDLGGVAKGHALDLAALSLREDGITRALLHGGTSSAIALGSPPDAEAWVLSVPDPESGAERVRVFLRDQAFSVSAPSGRRAAGPEGEVGHVIDPRSGLPASSARLALALHPVAAAADAYATAGLITATIDDPELTLLRIDAEGQASLFGPRSDALRLSN